MGRTTAEWGSAGDRRSFYGGETNMYTSTYQAEVDMYIRVREEHHAAGQRRRLQARRAAAAANRPALGDRVGAFADTFRTWLVRPPEPREECC